LSLCEVTESVTFQTLNVWYSHVDRLTLCLCVLMWCVQLLIVVWRNISLSDICYILQNTRSIKQPSQEVDNSAVRAFMCPLTTSCYQNRSVGVIELSLCYV